MTVAGSDAPTSVRFAADVLDLFARASHDRNPLHVSDAYARTTQFGEPVVFGVMGGLSCLAAVPLNAGTTLSRVKMEFSGPLFLGIDYQRTVQQLSDCEVLVTLSDGPRVLISSVFTLVENHDCVVPLDAAPVTLRETPADRSINELTVGLNFEGTYQPKVDFFEALMVKMNLHRLHIAPSRIAALLWASYLVGMELPGRQALFSELTCDFAPNGATSSPIEFSATIRNASTRYGLVVAAFETTSALRAHSRGEIRAFVRRERLPATVETLRIDQRTGLRGKTALVVGGSRGLGAALATGLSLRGATVYASYQKSSTEMERICEAVARQSAVITPLQGDGADLAWCDRAVRQIVAKEGHLDILVCNAAPTVLPMPFSAFSVERVNRYVADSFALVSNPVAASLDALSKAHGWAVAISSMFANFNASQFARARASYPHYVAAKSAIEALFQSLAAGNGDVGFMIARPPRLQGELPVPFGEGTALAPNVVADALIDALIGDARLGRQVVTVEDFR
jgi:NAD(P)-dependent dehydrogenase (short-subunit alcohol dehydrogenase family)